MLLDDGAPALAAGSVGLVDRAWWRVEVDLDRAAVAHRAPRAYERWVKPAVDRGAALVLLAVLLPTLLVVAFAVRCSLGPGVLYRQTRVGQHGRPFEVLKFRTMHHDRRTARAPYAGPERRRVHKSPHDPRHTTVGRVLRRYSLDELPQLWNVVRGDLSLVGPRPELVEIVERHYLREHDVVRHAVRPGLTGLWQVTERGDGTLMHEHLDTDLRYVEELSLRMDLWILARTLPAVLTGNRGD